MPQWCQCSAVLFSKSKSKIDNRRQPVVPTSFADLCVRERIFTFMVRSKVPESDDEDGEMSRLLCLLAIVWTLAIGWLILAIGCLSTDEYLECRANLSATTRNDSQFRLIVDSADLVFTGKIEEIRKHSMVVRVKRLIKGLPGGNSVILGLHDPCSAYVRPSYTGIFVGKQAKIGNYEFVNSFGPIPLTLANLGRVGAAVQGRYR